MMNTFNKGFTLIELMIVVAIIAILSTVAYPAYTEYSKKVHRTGAQSALKSFGIAMEKVRLEKQEYRQANGNATDITNLTPPASLFFAQAPLDTSNKTYDLTIMSANINTFVLKATPITASMMAGDGHLEFHSSGKKGWDQDTSGSIDADEWCWPTSKKSC